MRPSCTPDNILIAEQSNERSEMEFSKFKTQLKLRENTGVERKGQSLMAGIFTNSDSGNKRFLLLLVAVACLLSGGVSVTPLIAQEACPWCAADWAPRFNLQGVVDLHVHSAPDSGPRSIGALEIARIARDAGMKAILLKNHYAPTAGLAYAVERAVPGIRVFGGIALNASIGINVIAVEHMARTTGGHGKVVWMPTFDSEHYHRVLSPNPNHLPIAENSKLREEVIAVLEKIAEHDLMLATGHSSPEESLLLIREARKLGIGRILVTHPLPPPVGMSIALQKRAASLGALLEYPVGTALGSNAQWDASGEEMFQAYVDGIREVGPENVVITSDLGQSMNPIHTDGLSVFLGKLLAAGFTQSELELMAIQNPSNLLGLP